MELGNCNFSMSSEQFICAFKRHEKTSELIIINANNGNILKYPITADAVILNPSGDTVALKCMYFINFKAIYSGN